MLVEKDLYTGLQFKTIYDNKTLYTLNLNMINNVTWLQNNEITSTNYSLNLICDFINRGEWFIAQNLNKIYECW